MNIQLDASTKQSVEKAYISHVLRYVGVGLISGSIVHMGTLGGGYIKYVVLIVMGIIAFITGTLLEKRGSETSLTSFIIVSVLMSIGVGMVSGGTQHYLDGPEYAAVLIPTGITIGYFAFLIRDYKSKITKKRILIMLLVATGIATVLYFIAKKIPAQQDHHYVDKNIQNKEEIYHNEKDGHFH